MATRLVCLVLVLTMAACGGASPTTESTPAASTSTSTPAPEPTTTSTTSSVTTTPAATTTTTTVIDVGFAGGEVVGTRQLQVALGDTVDFWVVSDVADELHVHGYDLLYELTPGVPVNITFVADVPGVFSVEIHTGHTELLEIEVMG